LGRDGQKHAIAFERRTRTIVRVEIVLFETQDARNFYHV
jgi:hypothetical protein